MIYPLSWLVLSFSPFYQKSQIMMYQWYIFLDIHHIHNNHSNHTANRHIYMYVNIVLVVLSFCPFYPKPQIMMYQRHIFHDILKCKQSNFCIANIT